MSYKIKKLSGNDPIIQSIPYNQLLQKTPQLKRGEEGYDWRELDLFLAKLRAMLGPPLPVAEGKSAPAFNIINAMDTGYNPGTEIGNTTTPSGTVDLMINGVVYHLLRADTK